MYRTGDLARYRSDGVVEFIGRRDGQVKIRGYRVELGEIESALCRHPDVQKAALIMADHRLSGKHLVAWAAVGTAKVTPDDLRRFVEQSLPPYMVPKIIVCVDALKLTSNGKIDRQALASSTPTPASVEFRAPADDVEECLVAVWRSVLGVEEIGADDNYFSLGGDSLRVIQLVQEARHYGIVIAATDVLRYPTIRQLRQEVHAKSRRGLFPEGLPALTLSASETLSPAMPSDVTDFYPVSGIQSFMLGNYSRGIFHIQDCFHAADASFSYPALESAFQAVMDRHPALRTVFDLQSVPPRQWVRSHLRCPMNLEDISHLETSVQEDHIAVALRTDREKLFDPFDRETPLFRVRVFQRSESEFNLMFSCHHAIMDGWGHRALLNDLVKAYLSLKSGTKADLGEPDIACREFATFQEAVRRSEMAMTFWREYLDGVNPAALTLPVSANLSVSQDQTLLHEASLVRHFTPELVKALLHAARKNAVSMQALTLSAWFEVLRALSGQELVVAGVIANGRSEYLSDPLSAVGLFWNIIPVVSRSTLSLSALAVEVQRDLAEAGPYSAYPIVQLLADRGAHELFSSTFRYLNFWNTQQIPKDSGLRLLGVRSYDRYSFPLNCSVVVDPSQNGGYLQLDYDPGGFERDRVAGVLDHYYSLLERVASESTI
jgi:aryl carrier-like protein